MENFLLIEKDNFRTKGNLLKIDRYFPSGETISRQFGKYFFYLTPKSKKYPKNYCENRNLFIGVIGTLSYKGLAYRHGLTEMLKDEENGSFSIENLCGNYLIFIWNGDIIKVINDGTGLLRAYINTERQIFCSSFRLLAELLTSGISLNKPAIIENLITGGIIGEDTILYGINVFTEETISRFNSVNYQEPDFKFRIQPLLNRSQAIKRQVEILDDYFLNFKCFADDFGIDIGLTSGFDSRLILAFSIRHYKDVQVHSHYRTIRSIEWDLAKLITDAFSLEFISPQVKSFESFGDEELFQVMSSSYKFYDAQIRANCNWNEEYNTLEYRLKTLRNKGLGFHGIGGEQYRNADRMCLNSWEINKWIKFKYVRRIAGSSFNNIKNENNFHDYLKNKISKQLGFEAHKTRLNLLDLKRIQNEIFIPSFRGARTSAENKISFFLSPFADFHVSRAAYKIIPFLDCTNNFEIDLIKNISPELARFPSNYGFSFDNKEPLLKYIIPTVFENLLPARISWKIREIYKQKEFNNSFKIKIESSKLLKKYVQNVYDLNLPFHIEKLLVRPDIAPQIISMGYFLENYKTFIK